MEFFDCLKEIAYLEDKKIRTVDENNRLKFLTLKIYDPEADDIIELIEVYNRLQRKESDKTISNTEIKILNALKIIYFE